MWIFQSIIERTSLPPNVRSNVESQFNKVEHFGGASVPASRLGAFAHKIESPLGSRKGFLSRRRLSHYAGLAASWPLGSRVPDCVKTPSTCRPPRPKRQLRSRTPDEPRRKVAFLECESVAFAFPPLHCSARKAIYYTAWHARSTILLHRLRLHS